MVSIFVLTNLAIWRDELLKVKVGSSSSISLIFPYGRSPVFIRAWNPLQIPIISPSFSSSIYSIDSLIFSFLRTFAMNLPEPSGSSPIENPPGTARMFAFLISLANSSMDFLISSSFLFLNRTILASAPASSSAFLVSYSLFVPKNARTSAFTLVTLFLDLSLLSTFLFSILAGFSSIAPLKTESRVCR